jgi:hypothetical protein
LRTSHVNVVPGLANTKPHINGPNSTILGNELVAFADLGCVVEFKNIRITCLIDIRSIEGRRKADRSSLSWQAGSFGRFF